jgi:hypothetical protein
MKNDIYYGIIKLSLHFLNSSMKISGLNTIYLRSPCITILVYLEYSIVYSISPYLSLFYSNISKINGIISLLSDVISAVIAKEKTEPIFSPSVLSSFAM